MGQHEPMGEGILDEATDHGVLLRKDRSAEPYSRHNRGDGKEFLASHVDFLLGLVVFKCISVATRDPCRVFLDRNPAHRRLRYWRRPTLPRQTKRRARRLAQGWTLDGR